MNFVMYNGDMYFDMMIYPFSFYKDVRLGHGQYLKTSYFTSSYLYLFPRLKFFQWYL